MPEPTFTEAALSRTKLVDWILERMGELARERQRAVESTSYTSAGIYDARHAQLYELLSHMGAGDLDDTH